MTSTTTTGDTLAAGKPSMFRQPVAVWAIAFAAMVSFMGIGLVDPILPAISRDLGATPAQTMLLFTSYLLVTSFVMFFAGAISSRLGVKRTLLLGLAVIVVFATASAMSPTVSVLLGFRAGWGLGNALFISTALSAIAGAASGGSGTAIILYEAALGIGMAVGPLLGGMLGSIHWSMPFYGTAVLMAIAFLAIVSLLRAPAGSRPEPIPFGAGFSALKNPALRTLALTALFYNFAFFVLLAYSPYPIEHAAAAAGQTFGAHELGLVFFGWGLGLAITSVLVAPLLTRRLGLRPVLFVMFGLLAAILLAMSFSVHSVSALVALIVAAGLMLGVLNTSLTEAVMEATDLPRSVASSTYSGVRFLGGAIAPAVAGPLAAATSAGAPYLLGAGSMLVAIVSLLVGGRALTHLGRPHETGAGEAEAITVGDEV